MIVNEENISSKYDPELIQKLTMNKQIIAKIKALGDSMESRGVDYFFYTPNKKDADALAAHLKREKGYSVKVNHITEDWCVTGKSKSIRLFQADVDDWVIWMYNTGKKFNCLFDGWGTDVHKIKWFEKFKKLLGK